MAKPKPKEPIKPDKIEVEPGAEGRLAKIFAKTLDTPPRHEAAKAKKPKSK